MIHASEECKSIIQRSFMFHIFVSVVDDEKSTFERFFKVQQMEYVV